MQQECGKSKKNCIKLIKAPPHTHNFWNGLKWHLRMFSSLIPVHVLPGARACGHKAHLYPSNYCKLKEWRSLGESWPRWNKGSSPQLITRSSPRFVGLINSSQDQEKKTKREKRCRPATQMIAVPARGESPGGTERGPAALATAEANFTTESFFSSVNSHFISLFFSCSSIWFCDQTKMSLIIYSCTRISSFRL